MKELTIKQLAEVNDNLDNYFYTLISLFSFEYIKNSKSSVETGYNCSGGCSGV